MIILITGASCTGKTLLAQKLLEKYKIPYLSIDHLKMGIYRSDKNCGFTPESPDDLITEKLWPILIEIIKTNIENNQNLIIEGCYLPVSIEDMEDEYRSKIIMLSLAFSENYIRKNLSSLIFEKRSIIENRESGFIEDMEEYISENLRRKADCNRNNIKLFEFIEDYEAEMSAVYEWLEELVY